MISKLTVFYSHLSSYVPMYYCVTCLYIYIKKDTFTPSYHCVSSPGAGTPNFFFVQSANYLESELKEW